jgi:hypothetical protein
MARAQTAEPVVLDGEIASTQMVMFGADSFTTVDFPLPSPLRGEGQGEGRRWHRVSQEPPLTLPSPREAGRGD